MNGRELDALMVKIAQGDNAAFERLYRETAKGIYAFAYSYLNNKSDAEDATQSAFLQIKQKAYTYKTGTNARAWMFQIVKNLAIDELRRRQRSAPFPSEEEAFADARETESAPALGYMLRTLSADEREIVILHVFWGYKHREIARLLQIPLGTVTWKYNAAIKKLRNYEEEQ